MLLQAKEGFAENVFPKTKIVFHCQQNFYLMGNSLMSEYLELNSTTFTILLSVGGKFLFNTPLF